MTDGFALMCSILDSAARIEVEKNGRALTPEEARTVRAAAFLRKIAPYGVTGAESRPAADCAVDPVVPERD